MSEFEVGDYVVVKSPSFVYPQYSWWKGHKKTKQKWLKGTDIPEHSRGYIIHKEKHGEGHYHDEMIYSFFVPSLNGYFMVEHEALEFDEKNMILDYVLQGEKNER